MVLHDIDFGYSAESAYEKLTDDRKNSIRKIYPLLPELTEKGLVRIVTNSFYPPQLSYEYKGLNILFYVKPFGRAVIVEIRP